MPRGTDVVPDVPMDEAIVPAIVPDMEDRDMETIKSLLTQAGLRTECVSYMDDAVAKTE